MPMKILNLEKKIEEFLKSDVKAAREDGRYKSLRADFKDLLLHVDRRKYEITHEV